MNMNQVYRKIAKKHGVTVAEVKRDIQVAIDCAYMKSDKTEAEERLQKRACAQSGIPTTEELIQFIVDEVQKNRTSQ